MYVPGADPGLVVRGAWVGEGSRGPLKVPSWSGVEPWYGQSPPEALGILGITDIYLNDNFEPTTPFLSDPKNLILSLNCCRIIVNSIFLSDYKNLKSNFFWATVMRIVQLMTDRSRYFNPSKNYWFSFNAFFISLIGLYFRCLSFRVVLVNTDRPDGAFLFVVWFIHWKHMIRPFLFIDKQKRTLSANPYMNQQTHPTCIYNV